MRHLDNDPETKGAWIIHHGRKITLDANGPPEFPAIDEAAKAATLLTNLSEGAHTQIPIDQVRAIAAASGLNPRHELLGLLQTLEKKRLVEVTDHDVTVLGVTPIGALGHAVDVYADAEPSQVENASIELAELASQEPVRRSEMSELIGDHHQLTNDRVSDFIDRSLAIGFVDKEGTDHDPLLFNGNLFRRDSVVKSQNVLSSLSSSEQLLVAEVADLLRSTGCLTFSSVEHILSAPLLEKLVAAGVYDLNKVNNEYGSHVYVTSPSAFHKYVNPMVDDCFDLAKSLVAALTYGMTFRSPTQGRIHVLPALIKKLVNGDWIGPATAIGQDYRALEVKRVVTLAPSPEYPGRFHMRLLKKEVGELALQVLTHGSAAATSFYALPTAPMDNYIGPEQSRVSVRRQQTPISKSRTEDILEALRGGRPF